MWKVHAAGRPDSGVLARSGRSARAHKSHGEERGKELADLYGRALPEEYKAGTEIPSAVNDIRHLESLRAGTAMQVDVANPLDFSKGMPPTLAVCNTDSLGEQIQRAFPEARVVKSLNTMSARVMVDPKKVPGDHAIFVCGNDATAKSQVTELLREFGWKTVLDLGDISGARGAEMVFPLWVRLMGTLKSPNFNFIISRGDM